MDPQPVALGEQQELRVEKRAVVLDERQEPSRDVRSDRLEAAPGVGEPDAERGANQAAVDQVALEAAPDSGVVREPRADGELAVARQHRRDERQEALQLRGEVDVNGGDDVRVAREPRRSQRDASSLPRGHGFKKIAASRKPCGVN